jgi:hypothetical protein
MQQVLRSPRVVTWTFLKGTFADIRIDVLKLCDRSYLLPRLDRKTGQSDSRRVQFGCDLGQGVTEEQNVGLDAQYFRYDYFANR